MLIDLRNGSKLLDLTFEAFSYVRLAGSLAPEADVNVVADNAIQNLPLLDVEAHKRQRMIKEKVKQVLITLGGADTYGFTPRVLQAVAAAFSAALLR